MSKNSKSKNEDKPNLQESAKSWFDKGIENLKSDNYQKALECFEEVIKIDPEYKDVWFQMGWTYSSLDNIQEAIKCYEKSKSLEPKNEDTWYNLGNLYLNHILDYQKAIEHYEKAIELYPKYSFAWNNMGFAYFKLEDYQKAAECHEKAVEIDPENEYAWVNLGNANFFLKNSLKALECYEKAVELDPMDDEAWTNMMVTVKRYESELTPKPEHNNGWLRIGIAYIKLGGYKEAIKCFKNVIKSDSENFEAWHNIGAIFQKVNDQKKYTELFEKPKDLFKNLKKISIVTTSEGPFSSDVFWLFEYPSDIAIIPSEGQDSGLLNKAQKLPDFDNETVIKAMTSTEDKLFVCWTSDN